MQKLKLNLESLREHMELLDMEDLLSIKGGYGGYYGYASWNEFIAGVQAGQVGDGTYYQSGEGGGYGVHSGYAPSLTWLSLSGGYSTWAYGNSSNPGGYGAPNPSQTVAVMNYIKAQFPTFFSDNPNVIVSVSNTPPPGANFTYNSTTQTFVNSNGQSVSGITYKSGNLTFIYLSPNVGNAIASGGSATIIEHELLHAQHIRQYESLYNSNRSKFNLESEYAAYYNQWYDAAAAGRTSEAAQCYSNMNMLMMQGAEGIFSSGLD